MKRLVAGICIAVSVALAAALIVIMIAGMTGRSIFNWGFSNMSFGNVRMDSFVHGESVLVKEDSLMMNDVRDFEFIGDSQAIYVRGTDSDRMTVRQYSNRSLEQDELFRMSKSGEHVTVDTRRHSVRIGLFMVWSDDRIEIEMPNSWTGDVEMKISSGGIKIEDEFEWADVSIRSTSGGLNIERGLKGREINLSVSSGGMNLKDTITAESLFLKSTSGGIKTERLEVEGSANIECSSGGISFKGALTAADVFIRCTSGTVNTSLIEADDFEIISSSGGLKIEELNGQGYVKSTAGGIKIDLLNPTGNVELKCSSGGIRVEVPRDLRHFVSTSSTSGTVSVTER